MNPYMSHMTDDKTQPNDKQVVKLGAMQGTPLH